MGLPLEVKGMHKNALHMSPTEDGVHVGLQIFIKLFVFWILLRLWVMVFSIAVGMAKTNEIFSHHVNKNKKTLKKLLSYNYLWKYWPKAYEKTKN